MVVVYHPPPKARVCMCHPFIRAGLAAGIYIVVCILYIVISSHWAATSADTLEEYKAIELMKGIAFVTITGIIFFGISYIKWRLIQKQEHTIALQEKHLLQSERKMVATMFASVLAHDVNNVLMVLYCLLEELKVQETDDESFTSTREGLEHGIDHLSHLAKRIALAVQEALPEDDGVVNIRESISRLISLAQKHPALRECAITSNNIPEISLSINAILFEEAFLNMLLNAGQACGAKGRINLRVYESDGDIVLEMHDNGSGVPLDDVDTLFTPAYTTKPDGTGLGLLAVKAFAHSCNGTIIVDKSDLGGALFALRIPKTHYVKDNAKEKSFVSSHIPNNMR